MNINIRHWLTEHCIEIHQLRQLKRAQLVGVAFRIVQDMEFKSLVPFDICTVVEVLELPLSAVWQEITAIAQLTASLVTALSQIKPLKRNEGTWLAFQVAYLQALQQVLDEEQSHKRIWLDKAMILEVGEVCINNPPIPLQNAQLLSLLKTLHPGKLSDTQAEQALSLVADSLLVQQMNSATIAWFVTNGADELEAKLLAQRILYSLYGHLLIVIAENAPPLAQLQKFVRLSTLLPATGKNGNYTRDSGVSGASINYINNDQIDLYREHYRASLIQSLSKPLLMESFTLKDIYVPLKVAVESGDTTQTVDLMVWVQQQLTDLKTIAVVESEPGYGKTSFCQMFAAQVARELYPEWMPIFIRLRDITYGKSLAETLSSGIRGSFSTNFAASLDLYHPQCLLILDGLDELPPSSQGKMAKMIFLEQLLSLQAGCRHKILLTTGLTTLQDILGDIPLEMRRVRIQPLEQEELRQWFQQWSKVQSLTIAQNYFNFLKENGLFNSQPKLVELASLIRQPLTLYLLGVLYRDGLLDDEILQIACQKTSLLYEIHQRLSGWLLGYPLLRRVKTVVLRSHTHIHRTTDAVANLLCGRHPQELQQQMQAIALDILHSQSQINFTKEANIPALYFKINQNIIEFSHLKLGEYLCAQALSTQLELLTQRQEDTYGTKSFVQDSHSFAQHLYNLLGYGILTPEIEALIIEGLRQEQKREFSFEILCDRLLSFWYAYCRGRWLDEGLAHKALTHFRAIGNPVNVEQINAAVGTNVFFLLCVATQEAKISFLPCGNPILSEFYPGALINLINKTSILSKSAFTLRMRSKYLAKLNLSRVYLPQVVLSGADLQEINFANAELTGANLAAANLQAAYLSGANLAGANLAGANLTGANLTGANLTGANLSGVNLKSVNLTNACLFNANLSDSEREMALINGGIFSLQQFQTLKRVLSQERFPHTDSTTNTDSWLDTSSKVGLIESAEGEIMSPMYVDDDYAEDETVFGVNPEDF
jgi:hypothetical protein